MANDLGIIEQKEEMADITVRQPVRGNPIDYVAPTCMFWAMVVGLTILIGVIIIWAISHTNLIPG